MCVAGAALLMLAAAAANAGERKFVFSYEATTTPAGTLEFEQGVTWKTSKKSDSDFDRFDVRHEIEWGVTDRFQLGFYVFDWRYQDGASVANNRAEFRDVAVEAIYNLSNPVTDPIGAALYGEVKGGDELFALEGKIILQKNLGPVILVWNGTLEAEWEGDDFDEDNGTLEQTFGVSYQLHPGLSVGAELLHEVEYADWSAWGDHVVYLGPNVSLATKKWWVTIAPLVQVTSVDDEPDFQTRVMFGISF